MNSFWRSLRKSLMSRGMRFLVALALLASMAASAQPRPAAPPAASLIDLNTASRDDLMNLEGIGEVRADGQFNIVWKTPGPVKAKPWSPFIEGNDKKKDEPDGKTKI